MEIKSLVFVCALLFGILLILYTSIFLIVNTIYWVKTFVDSKKIKNSVLQSTSLRKSLDSKIQMHKEETSNHEFDNSTSYNNKIKIGTAKLNEYKKENNILLLND